MVASSVSKFIRFRLKILGREKTLSQNEKARSRERAFQYYSGDHLISHTPARAVPSAQRGLTSVFGMGTGGTLAVWSPETQGVFKA
jgi:hypothetical protein